MKKLIVIAAALAVVSSSAFAKKWTNNIGIGLDVPFSQLETKDEGKTNTLKQTGFTFDATYLGIHENGFCAKADYYVGAYNTKDLSQKDESMVGIFNSIAVGAGWALVNDSKKVVTLTGMIGVDVTTYSEDETVGEYEIESEYTFVSLAVGADLFASYRFKEHFGVYANLGVYYLPTGSISGEIRTKHGNYTETYKLDDSDLTGKYRISPSIGIVWNF